jgi:hypothetical protein
VRISAPPNLRTDARTLAGWRFRSRKAKTVVGGTCFLFDRDSRHRRPRQLRDYTKTNGPWPSKAVGDQRTMAFQGRQPPAYDGLPRPSITSVRWPSKAVDDEGTVSIFAASRGFTLCQH